MQSPSCGSGKDGAGETPMEYAPSDSLIQEIQRGYALMGKLQSLLDQDTCTYGQIVLAKALLEEAVEVCNSSLSKLMRRDSIKVESQISVAAIRHHPVPCNFDATEGDHGTRMPQDSWEVVTIAPYHDGYEWRKYGEKKISGFPFPRCYYRCAYREEQGCAARKQVQQQNNDDPPLFMVTYRKEHTCNIGSPTSYRIYLANNIPSPQPLFLQFDWKDYVNLNMKPLPGSLEITNQNVFLGGMLHNDVDASHGQFSRTQQLLALDNGYVMVEELDFSELDVYIRYNIILKSKNNK